MQKSYMSALTQGRLVLHGSLNSPPTVVVHSPHRFRSEGIIKTTINPSSLSTEEDLIRCIIYMYIYIHVYIYIYIFNPSSKYRYKQVHQYCTTAL